MAGRAGVHRNTVIGWEQGNDLPKSRTHIQALADALYLDEQDTVSLLRAGFFLEGDEQHHALADKREVPMGAIVLYRASLQG